MITNGSQKRIFNATALSRRHPRRRRCRRRWSGTRGSKAGPTRIKYYYYR